MIVIGTKDELLAYRDAIPSNTTIVHAPSLSPALSAVWHLFRAGYVAKKNGANVLLLCAANRRMVWRSPIPSVAVVHDLAQLEVENKYDALRMFYIKRIVARLLRKATNVVAISKTTRSHMVRALGIRERSVRVVLNGIDHDRFHPRAATPNELAALRRKFAINQPFLLYPARLEHPGKNHTRLLKAFATSSIRDSHLLLFAGRDWGAQKQLTKLTRDLGLSRRVRFLGFVSDAELPILTAAADAVTMVGLFEGFGLPAAEALACGSVVVNSTTGALPEVTGKLGIPCDPTSISSIARAIERAVDHKSHRELVADQGPTWAGRYRWQDTGSSLVNICSEVA
jgi:glycosyltransferase involved in cell wall biosynthesis